MLLVGRELTQLELEIGGTNYGADVVLCDEESLLAAEPKLCLVFLREVGFAGP